MTCSLQACKSFEGGLDRFDAFAEGESNQLTALSGIRIEAAGWNRGDADFIDEPAASGDVVGLAKMGVITEHEVAAFRHVELETGTPQSFAEKIATLPVIGYQLGVVLIPIPQGDRCRVLEWMG